MDRRLFEASLQGNVAALIELLQEDPLILDRTTIITSFSNYINPLHIAAMRGHLEFARLILKHKPELASKSDSQGFSPLHWASTSTNNVDLVRELLWAEPSACLSTDSDGTTPLHLATIEGSVEIMRELFKCRPEASQKLVLNRGETILHLCVIHGRFQALKLLLQWLHSEGISSVNVNSKDYDGNTVLHLAVAKKHFQMVQFLLSNTEVEVNALNHNGFTALDILSQNPISDLKDIEVGELLRSANALRAKNVLQVPDHGTHVVTITNNNTSQATDHQAVATASHSTAGRPRPSRTSTITNHIEKHENWLEKKRNTLMVVASLIATMAFQGGVNPPGGFWQDDGKNNETLISQSNNNNTTHEAGTSIMASKHQYEYVAYMIFNTTGFLTSLSVTLLLVSGVPLRRKFFIWVLMFIMWLSITSMCISYYFAIAVVCPSQKKDDIVAIVGYAVCGWVVLLFFILLVHVIRFVLWLLKMIFRMLSWLCKRIICCSR